MIDLPKVFLWARSLATTAKLLAVPIVLVMWALATLLVGQHHAEPATAKAGWLVAVAMAALISEHERARRRRESRRA